MDDEIDLPVPPPEAPPPHRPRLFRWSLLVMILAAVLLGLVAGARYWEANRAVVRTDNARTMGDMAPVSSRIAGIVVKVNVHENQYVKAGAVVVELDPTDHRLGVDRANAELAAVRAQVQAARAALAAQQQAFAAGLNVAQAALQASQPRLSQAETQVLVDETTAVARVAQAQARVDVAQAGVRAAKANLDLATRTANRDRELYAQGAISAQIVETDAAALEGAQARYQGAQETLREGQADLASAEAARQQVAITRQAVVVNKAEIARAEAVLTQAAGAEAVVHQRAQELAVAEARAADAATAVKVAEANLERTIIRAPADGWITNLTVEIGQVLQPNQPIMALTLSHHIWIVANIKETQIGRIRTGNPVRVTIDAFPGRVFHGRVQSIGAATGSSTALLPPDNATGNFVKVVQLVPVRIDLDADPDPGPELQIGLSAEVTIDVQQTHR